MKHAMHNMECKKGYFGDSCDEPCPPGFFGLQCGGNCLPRCNKEECHHISGCPNRSTKKTESECNKGYFGDSCDETCPSGSFGLKCGGNCLPRCTKEECHHISGCPGDIMTTLKPLEREPTLLTTNETSWRITASNSTSAPNTHTLLITEVPSTQMELTRVNILAGGSLLIVIVLIAIIRELYTCQSKNSTENTREQNGASDVSVDIVQERNELVSKEKSPNRIGTNSIQYERAQYFSIDNVLDVRHSRINMERQRTTRNILAGLFNCISGRRRTKNFVEV